MQAGDTLHLDSDQAAMALALDQARLAIGLSDPNPRVGCVITDGHGRLLGLGHTQQAGGPHAEVMALRDAAARGADLRGATVYVTLEPCAHHGRTPPCCDALVAAGVGRVVAACGDPNPLVQGQGLARLRAAGIAVELGLGQAEAHELNLGFFSRMLRGRPWVRVKAATSLDGRTALPDGQSQWITGPEARRDGHAWRRRAGAVLSGSGTVLADDPRLDVRLVPSTLQPLRVVVDGRLRMPPAARVLAPPGQTLVVTTAIDAPTPAARAASIEALQARGAEVLALPAAPPAAEAPAATGPHAADGSVDLAALLAELARRGVNELHVEAGATLNAALLAGGWVDEWLIYLAPMLVGSGRGIVAMDTLGGLAQAPRLVIREVTPVGADLRVLARPAGADLSWLAPA